MNTLERDCIYLRKSRADREAEARGEEETLARHERILLDLAKRRGCHIGAIYREVVSGETISARPVMQRLLQEVESGMWDGVLVVEVERLARGDSIDQGVVARAFQYSDTKIITPTKTYDPNNEFDEEYFEFGLFMSRREYKTIKRRLNAGRVSSVQEGKYCGNKPPYGYRRVKLEHTKGYSLEPIPEQAEIVKLIYNWYTYGIDGERIGMCKITRKLIDMGVPSLSGKSWSTATVANILENPVYTGKIRWNRRKGMNKIENGNVVKSRPRCNDYILTDGLHEAIISQEIYDLAQYYRSMNPPRPIGASNTVKNPLSGLIKCGKCGHNMVRRPYNNRKQEDTLLCSYTGCNNVSSRLSLVEKALIAGLAELVQSYKINDTLNDTNGVDIIATKEKILLDKRAELENLNAQKNKQYELLEQGIYTTEVFLERSGATAKQIEDCTAAIERIDAELVHDRELLDQKFNFIPKCEHLLSNYWDWDAPTRNSVLKELLERVDYYKDSRNEYKHGDEITFTLDIYPKIQ